MNTSRTGNVDWDELVSHLILGYFGNDAENQRESLQPPIMGLPVIMRSEHRHPISRICFCPDVDKICTMHYRFSPDINEKCMLICGDVGGNVRVLLFSPVLRGPFRNEAGRALISLRHVDLQKRPRMLPELRLVDLGRMHSEWVRQVSYYESLHCVVSCATCSDSLLLCDISGSKTHYMFKVEKGIQCFEFDEESHVLVTGGPDCTVRVWNPFVPAKANVVLIGHHAAVTCIVLQNKGQTIYSLSRDRTIKVWDIQSHSCIQTYIDIPAVLGERSPISAVYNPATREFLLACIKIAVVVLDEQLNPLHTDGNTHSRAVSKILYNPLFKLIISCGMDSIIINWNPVTAVGWNRHVVEFEDSGMATHGKSWETRHTDDVLASAVRPPLSLATASYNSELVLWKLETGQPYSKRESLKQPPVLKPDMKAKRTPSRKIGSNQEGDRTTRVSGASAGSCTEDAPPRRARHDISADTTATCAPSLMLALENGQMQCWSDHSAGGYQSSFQANHSPGDYVSCLATDVANEFLFTGTTRGAFAVLPVLSHNKNWKPYIMKEHINMPRLRLMFPFLWRDRIEGRAKRCVRDQPEPLLLNSYRAHLRCVTSIAYMDEHKLFFR
ncbi:hypothetical protein HF086_007212 [Spodoptera exigua]|uniref:WD repeat-containing protein on Y chromosome n=1 Tax=Spodoptera exigua TaxID=7107 RepID=A0A922SKX9_SPOEX|nr:hypothetical protein HF086_007212 [Spodoptera exigua]